MDALVRTLLNYASVGHDSMSVTRVSLLEVVGAVVTMLEPTIQELRAEVSYADLPMIDCDPVLVRQLIQNLVGNALKYRDPKVQARIRISAQQRDRQCIVSVSDNGPGIAPEHHALVFLPLKRLHGNEIPGTGMGLALCRKIVERHGGEIWLNSEIGSGATFCFSLPMLQETKKKVTAGSAAGTGASAVVA
jgi:signal transduction histidine kinase